MRSVPGARTPQVEPRARLRRGGGRGQRPAQREQLRGDVVALGVERLAHVDLARDPLLLGVAEEAQLRVDQAAQALGITQRERAADRADVVGGELARRVGQLALERQRAAGERPAHPLELGRALAEAHAAAQPLDAVREAAQAQAGTLQVERAAHHRRRAAARDRDDELGVAGSAKAARQRREHAQVGVTTGRERERPVAQEVRGAVDGQVGPLAAEVNPAELEAARGEPQLHRLARAHGKVGHQQLDPGERRLRAHLGRPRERPLDARVARRDDREPLRQLLAERAQERIEAGALEREAQVRFVGRRRVGGSRERQVDAPGAAAPVHDHAAVAGSAQARLEGAYPLVPQEQPRRAERRLEAGAGEGALQQQLTGDAAAQRGRGRGRGHEGAQVDVHDLARAVVDAVVAHAAREADVAAAEPQLAARHLGAPRSPAGLEDRLVVGDAVVAAGAGGALRLALGGAAPAAHVRGPGHLPARRHVPLHEAHQVLDGPARRAGATRERVLLAQPADLGCGLPIRSPHRPCAGPAGAT